MGRGRGRAPRTNWQDIKKENAKWEEYYLTLGLPTADKAEFDKYKAVCQNELPVTFRITGTSADAVQVREIMEARHIAQLANQSWDGQPIEPPQPLPFYPGRLAWQVNVGKQVIRRNEKFSDFQRFLVVETNAGNISRQELVSMIPPLLLDVQPHHFVLDTCASPGSKTAQLIEALHAQPNPTGLVIANDSDYKRSHMLTHQVKRLNSPNVMVTNHDAQMYPRIWLGSSYLKFDRILCDVPCTGDGTMRKNINVWKDWKVNNGYGLHNLQRNIATRSVHLLKPGGRLVYSTCSLNPIENEAVVGQLLRQFPNLRLLDVSNELVELKRSPGIDNWKVQRSDTHEWCDLGNTDGLQRSWFRPTEEEAARFHLERCVRVYPNQQNSGGFFIAVLQLDGEPVEVKDIEASQTAKRKSGTEPEAKRANTGEAHAPAGEADDAEDVADGAESAEATAAPADAAPEAEESGTPGADSSKVKAAKPAKLPRDIPATEDPFSFLEPTHPELQSCIEFYGLDEKFPTDTLIVRNATGEPARTIYYVAPSLAPILKHKEAKLKVIHAGIKVFNAQRNDGACKWRVQIEGIAMLTPFAHKRILRTDSVESLKPFCLETFIRFDALDAIDASLSEQLRALEEGCCIWQLGGAVYPLWRGKASANLMAPKEKTEELLLRLFNIDKKLLQKQAAAESSAANDGDNGNNGEGDNGEGNDDSSDHGATEELQHAESLMQSEQPGVVEPAKE